MKHQQQIITDLIRYAFIGLFFYTGFSKILTHLSFLVVLNGSPSLRPYSLFLSWAIPLSELSIGVLLLIPKTQKTGMILSTLLMLSFTIYILYMTHSKDKICSCGGLISKMSWNQHLWFNSVFIVLGLLALALLNRRKILRA